MPHRLLVIQSHSSLSLEVCLHPAVQDIICERIEWGPELCDRVREKNPDLVIVVAVSATEQAASLMVVLQREPLITPVLAISATDGLPQATSTNA